MGTLRAPVVAVLLGSLLLQGCAVAALTILGIAGGAGIKHTLTGIAYRTFSHSVAEVRAGVLHTLKHMAMTVTADTKTETGWQITATAENREIDIELERLTKHMTRMRAVANVGSIFFKDAATSNAIITKTEEKLSSSKAVSASKKVSASKARTSRRRPARRRRPPDTTPPSAPSMARVQADSASQTTVSWTAATDDVGVTAYTLSRNGTALATTPSLSYVDTGLTATTTYAYIVTALDAAGNESTPSAPVSATTLPLLDTTTPSRNPQEGPSSLPFELHPLLQFLFP